MEKIRVCPKLEKIENEAMREELKIQMQRKLRITKMNANSIPRCLWMQSYWKEGLGSVEEAMEGVGFS